MLSAPDKRSYVAVGFSGKGGMVGSTAMVAWSPSSSSGRRKGVAKEYYLQGRSPEAVTPDDGRLTLVRNRTATISSSGRLYLAFELSTDHPQPYLIYSVGYEGSIPSSDDDFKLQMHRDMGSRGFNYASGTPSIQPHSAGVVRKITLFFLFGSPTVDLCVCAQRRSLAEEADRADRKSVV